MLCILLFVPSDFAGPASSALRLAKAWRSGPAYCRRIFTRSPTSAPIYEDRLKIKETMPATRRIADCTGDNAGDSVGPSADGFETYGVTACPDHIHSAGSQDSATQAELLV